MDKAHPKNARKTEKKPMTRKAFQALFKPEHDQSKDFLDQPNVVSGGGFGVGKGKKR
jgi:hypothetical protein